MNIENKLCSVSQPGLLDNLRRLQTVCGHCYQAVLRRLAHVKTRIEREFAWKMNGQEQVLKAAMNEAEALAWQTPFPHLFFPDLAEEKATAAQKWADRQRAVRAGLALEAAAA